MDGEVIIGTKLDTKSFDKQIEDIEGKLEVIDQMLSDPKEIGLSTRDIEELNLEAEKLNNKLIDLVKKRDELNKKKSFEIFNQGLESVTKKVSRWVLAIFSVRSAYNLVRSAVNTLTQDNEQLATDIKFIQYAIAQTLKPIVEFLVKAVYRLLGFINLIYSKLFGTNLFTQEMVNNFNKANQSANKLRKTLAGFDEMNILNEDGTTGIASKIAPMVDLQNSTKEVDTWINKTSERFFNLGDELSSYLSKPNLFTKAYGVWDKFVHSIVRLFDGVYGVIRGLVDAVSGVIVTIYGIFTGNIELVKTGIKNLVKSIGTTFKGIIDVFKGIGGTIVGIFKAAFSGIWNGLVKGAKDAYNGVKNAFSPLASYFKTIFTNAWNGVKSVFSVGGQIYNGIKEGVTNAFKSIVNRLIDGINIFVGAPFKAINAMLNKIKNASVLGMKPFYWMWGDNPIKIPQIPKLAKGGIINMPGKGIPVGSAIGGERGQEGVIPLTDSQQMALLGEAIGRYITVNLTNVNEMNGRVLTRELKRIQNQNDFATNGR